MPSHRSELFAPPPSKPYADSLSAASAAVAAAAMEASSFPFIGDYIGMESCDEIEEPPDLGAAVAEPERYRRRRWEPKGRRRGQREEKKEYPPPIPLLARTGNLHSHMPWILRRHYTSDGRLILTEEKVRHHEYFRARRANGRLTLQLVPLNDDAPCLPMIADDDDDDDKEEEEEEEEISNPEAGITIAGDLETRDDDSDGDDCQGEGEDCAKLASSVAELTVDGGGGGGGGMGGNGTGKCSNYNGISVRPISPCIFRVPVPALRPVHS